MTRPTDVIQPAHVLTIASGRQHTIETIWHAWMTNKTPNTIRAYQQDLGTFALFVSRGVAISPTLTAADALQLLFRQGSAGAHEMVLAFRDSLQQSGMSGATINRHLAALRSISQLARQLGFCTWFLEIRGVKAERRRQTAGPSVAEIQRLLAATSGDTEADTRARAIVLVFFTMGLRVAELCRLNVDETDLERGQTWVLGKGRREKELVPIPAPTVDAIRSYLSHRHGTGRGPLFVSRGQHRKNPDGRLDTRSVLRIIRELGERVGLHVWNHGLRHSGITVATEQSTALGLSLDKVRAFSRHRGINTLLSYIDDTNRDRNQRALSDVVAATLKS